MHVGRLSAAPARDDGRVGDATYDALLLVSFGGPEGPADVPAFLANVTRGRSVPPPRLEEVAAHYLLFGGISPINEHNRSLLAELQTALAPLPVFWGNRNWSPYVRDALVEMREAGIRRALAYVTSAYSSYSGCRQYRENIAQAQAEVGPGAPVVDKLRAFYNHPAFIATFAEATQAALGRLPVSEREGAHLVFTAHSVPTSMAGTSAYAQQVREAARLVASAVAHPTWTLAWQSRSGPPQQSWLEPDVGEVLTALAAGPTSAAVVVPVGFVSDHLEVCYDLDTLAVPAARAAGLLVERAATPGSDPRIVDMIVDLVSERTADLGRAHMGVRGPSHDGCPHACCPAPAIP